MIRTLFLLLFLLFIPDLFCLAQEKPKSGKARLYGQVSDAKTSKSIPGASVMLVGKDRGTISDSVGAFTIDKLPIGNYSLHVSHISYKSRIIENIEIDEASKTVGLDIRLQRRLLSIKGITVTPSRFSIMGTKPTAQQSLTRQEIATVPQVGDDFFRAISRLPGIGSNDFSARMTVRGGEFDEVLVMLDGLKIYEPFHLKDVDGGAISIIDVAAIDGIDLMTGGFPVNYGDKMSGVFNIKSNQVEPGQRKFSVGLSLLNFKALGEGRFNNNKGSWLFSARRGYIDYVLKLTGDDDQLKPTYYDLYGKVDYQLNQNCIVSANFLHAGDKLIYSGVDKYAGNSLTTRYDNTYGWLNLKLVPSDRLAINTLVSTGKVDNNKYEVIYSQSLQIYDYSVRDRRDFRFFGFKTDWEYSASENYLIKIGIEHKRLWSDYDYLYQDFNYFHRPDGYFLRNIDTTNIIFEKSGNQFSTYLSNRIRLTKSLITELGLRYDYTSYSNDNLISPRINAVYNFSDRTSIRVGWGYFYQSEGINDIYIGDGETDYFPAEKAEHWIIGLQHNLKNGINFRLEGYYKIYSDLRRDMRTSFYSIESFPEFDYYRAIYYRAKSYSRGIELYLKKDMINKFSWCFSYAYTKAEDSLNYIYFPQQNNMRHQNEVLPTPYDQRHTIYFDLGYRPWSNWLLNIAWHYHTGWPYTDYKVITDINRPLYPLWGYNGQLKGRHKPFSRVDLRINKYFKIGKGRLTAFIELINALNRKNIRSYNFNTIYSEDRNYLEKKPEYWLRLLPSFGITYQVNF